MNEETLKNETRESKFVCPVCGQKFQDIVSYAAHLTEHSEEEKKRKADEAQKQREAKRKADIEKLERQDLVALTMEASQLTGVPMVRN